MIKSKPKKELPHGGIRQCAIAEAHCIINAPNERTHKIGGGRRTDRQKYSLMEAGCALPKDIEAHIPSLSLLLYLGLLSSKVVFH